MIACEQQFKPFMEELLGILELRQTFQVDS